MAEVKHASPTTLLLSHRPKVLSTLIGFESNGIVGGSWVLVTVFTFITAGTAACLVPFAKVSTFLVILAGEDFTLSGSRTNTLDAIAQKFAKLVATWIHEGRVVTSKGHIASDRFVKCLGKVPLIISCKS